MGFNERTEDACKLIEIMQTTVFEKSPCCNRIQVVPFGYETHILDPVRKLLRFVRTTTARYIKFAPDFFVIDKENPDGVYLLEFKATRTPLYSEKRINSIKEEAGDLTLDWTNIGQMEALAYENYLALSEMGIRVAVFNYCAYCETLLLCDYIENFKVIYKDVIRTGKGQGSGTPWVNFDTRSVRSFLDFFCKEHNFPETKIKPLLTIAIDELRKILPVSHHRNSPYCS